MKIAFVHLEHTGHVLAAVAGKPAGALERVTSGGLVYRYHDGAKPDFVFDPEEAELSLVEVELDDIAEAALFERHRAQIVDGAVAPITATLTSFGPSGGDWIVNAGSTPLADDTPYCLLTRASAGEPQLFTSEIPAGTSGDYALPFDISGTTVEKVLLLVAGFEPIAADPP